MSIGVPLLACTFRWYVAIIAEWTGRQEGDVRAYIFGIYQQRAENRGQSSKICLNLYELSPAQLEDLLNATREWSRHALRLELPRTSPVPHKP